MGTSRCSRRAGSEENTVVQQRRPAPNREQLREGLVVARIPKGARSEIRAVLREWKGELLAELRTFVRRKDGEWSHTVRGVSVPVGQADELAQGAQALADAAKSLLATLRQCPATDNDANRPRGSIGGDGGGVF